jgi:hypothetical protein
MFLQPIIGRKSAITIGGLARGLDIVDKAEFVASLDQAAEGT